jgi:heme-degrading monooxygenase HmoA
MTAYSERISSGRPGLSISTSISLALPLALALALAGAACSSDGDGDDGDGGEPTLAQRIETLATCTPTDLEVVSPWIGPAFDPDSGELIEPLPEGHVEAVAQGWRKYDDEAARLRMEYGQRVFADVVNRDGFLGFESVESEECDISIAHSLWRDEKAMLAFVTTAPHADARASAHAMHRAFAGTHWRGERRAEPPTWREGIDRYVQEMRIKLQ